MPLEVCRISRSLRSTVCKQEYYSAPDKGFCASQQTCYYGYKLHVVCSLEGVIRSFDLSKASVHDIYYLKNVKELYRDCVLLDDRGYLSTDYRLDLFESQRIVLECPYDEIRTITSCNILYSDAVEKESKRFSRNFVTRL